MEKPIDYMFKDFFAYEVDFPSLAANTSQSGTITIETQSDFMWQKACYFADIAAAAQTVNTQIVPLVSLIITDSGSSRQLMNSAVPVPSMFGFGPSPFILTTPKIFAARSVISFQVSNFSAATAYNLRLSLIGLKLFRG